MGQCAPSSSPKAQQSPLPPRCACSVGQGRAALQVGLDLLRGGQAQERQQLEFMP